MADNIHGNAPRCERCGTANFVIRRRCRDCGHDLVQHPDPEIDAEVRWDAEDGRRAELEPRGCPTPGACSCPPAAYPEIDVAALLQIADEIEAEGHATAQPDLHSWADGIREAIASGARRE